MSNRFRVFVAFLLTGCYAVQHQHMLVHVGKNSVEQISNDEYSIIYNGKKTTLRGVVGLVWFNNEPYFELFPGNVTKWDKEIANNASTFNLQKIFNKVYFVKQYAAGAEPCSVSLNIIDSNGYRELVIKKSGKPEIFEDYFVRYPDEIYVVPWGQYFALIDSVGNIIKIYDLNK
ncbi:hypothetical protein IBX73_10130 [candidate division WOR-3 bacterium]|nr:hypothetical protein [candidate division WOR-3 bacterium]